MLANYGYEDASGIYYIRIDTDVCAQCESKGCLKLCPAGLFKIEPDDYDDDVAVIREELRNSLRALCSGCKPHGRRSDTLPCQSACPSPAIEHSW